MWLLNPQTVSQLFPLRSYSLIRASDTFEDGDDFRTYMLALRKSEEDVVELVFTIPEPDKQGVMMVGQTHKVIIHHARRDANFELGRRSLKNVRVDTPADTVKWVVRDALLSALASTEPDQTVLQHHIDSFFATSPLLRVVYPEKPIDLEMSAATIMIDVAQNPVDYKERVYEDWQGAIDPTTTPTGRYVGQVFRAAKGASVYRGKLLPSKYLLNRSMEKYLVFPENDRPDRLLMTRSVLARHEELVEHEDPLVAHEEYDGRLKGTHLMTGIISHPLNYYDCIVISESAAEKLACRKVVRQTVIDTDVFEVRAYEGELINVGDPLLVSEDRTIYANKIKVPSVVTKAQAIGTMVGGVLATKYIFEFLSEYDMIEGDKLSSRHGSKGCVRIVANCDMPVAVCNGKEVALDILAHPRSFVGRRNLGVMREMMANAKCVAESRTFRTGHFSKEWSMEQLVEEGYGEKYPAYLHGEETGDVFLGPLYWLRTDKHALDMCSAVGDKKPVDQHGLNPDSGRAGQRLGPDVLLVMEAKGLHLAMARMLANSVEPVALEMMEKYLHCIE